MSSGYLRDDYQLSAWLTETDILFLAEKRNVPLLQIVREFAEEGLTAEDLGKLIDIITAHN